MIDQRTRHRMAQALVEIAVFGAVFIFIIGVIIRTHISTTQSQNHQVRAMKLAFLQSYQSSIGAANRPPNNARTSSSVIFLEDRLSPDFNKFNTIDRSPFIANGSGTMSNRMFYTVDDGEVEFNLPVTDLFINGQHFPLTTAAYVFRVLYGKDEDCPDDWVGSGQSCSLNKPCPEGLACTATGKCQQHGVEYIRCQRQKHERSATGNPVFYGLAVNGTQAFDQQTGSFDLLRNDWDDTNSLRCEDDVKGCAGTEKCPRDLVPDMCKSIAWQWRSVEGTAANINTAASGPKINIAFSSGGDNPVDTYPQVDTSGSLREQTLYAVTQQDQAVLLDILKDRSLAPYILNWNKNDQENGKSHVLIFSQDLLNNHPDIISKTGKTRNPDNGKPITGVWVLDNQLGDIDNSFDPNATPGPTPGLLQQSEISTMVQQGTYLLVKEGKLYNPETHAVVRSISSKDHVDMITRFIQLSNNTGRFCTAQPDGSWARPATLFDQYGQENPVQVCAQQRGGCISQENYTKTCYDPFQRIIYVRTLVGERTSRKWFTDVTKGL